MAGTLPLPAGTAEGRRGTVPFVAQVPAVVVAVADPAAQHAVAVVAAEEGGGAGAGGAGVVLVAAVLAVGVAIALPVGRHAAPVRLALELALVVAHAGRPGGWDGESPQVGVLKKKIQPPAESRLSDDKPRHSRQSRSSERSLQSKTPSHR